MEARREAMAELLGRLAEAESPTNAPESHAAAQAILEHELRTLGYTVRRIRGSGVGDHLYARPDERVRRMARQLLLGHLDTVWPLGTSRHMAVRRDGDHLFGPGVFDMKGGLVQMIFALRALRELDLAPAATPVVFVNSDEEIGSPDSTRWIGLLARGAARAFVLEPAFGTTGKLKTARKGAGRFEIRARGRAAHAGIDPEAGLSAILEISHQVQRLFALDDPGRGISVNVGTIDGGLRPNVVAPEAVAVVDVRAPSSADAARVEQAIRALTPVQHGVTLEVTGGFGRPAMERTPESAVLWETARDLGTAIDLQLEDVSVGGASDGNTTSRFTPTLDGLGAVGHGAHAHDEHVVVARMPERAALLGLLLAAPVAMRAPVPHIEGIQAAPVHPAPHVHVTSVARHLRLPPDALPGRRIARREWARGQYVVGEVLPTDAPRSVELADGRLAQVGAGDLLIGVLGSRAGTLEVVGDWTAIGDDLRMETLTRAGVLGRVTSSAAGMRGLMVPVQYAGHVVIDGVPLTMAATRGEPPDATLEAPAILIVGTSMSAGKTTTAGVIIRRLARMGLRVGGAKLTGVARLADVLAMRDAGTVAVADFVDAGLPSTIVERPVLDDAIRFVLRTLAAGGVDVVVCEAGASPLEPYGSEAALDALRDKLAMLVVCAFDAYAVVGIVKAFGITPDLVAGRATSTTAGVDLVHTLTGLPALDVSDPASLPRLDDLLRAKLPSAGAPGECPLLPVP
jgi:glutamate carboxypeptidase